MSILLKGEEKMNRSEKYMPNYLMIDKVYQEKKVVEIATKVVEIATKVVEIATFSRVKRGVYI